MWNENAFEIGNCSAVHLITKRNIFWEKSFFKKKKISEAMENVEIKRIKIVASLGGVNSR